MFLQVIFDLLSILTCLFILLKLFDMLYFSIIWNLRHGRKYCDDFHKFLKEYGPKEAIKRVAKYGYDPMKICRAISKFKPRWLFTPLSNYVYRWFSLTIIGASLMNLTSIGWLKWIMLILVLALIVWEFLHQLVSRLMLGVADNINRYTYVKLPEVESPENLEWHTSRILRDTVITLLVQLFVFIASYALIYRFIDQIDPRNFYPGDQSLSLLDSFYFSLVTITTIGYGDIYAASSLSKSLVMSQIVISWTIVVLVIFHYGVSMTVSFEERKR